MKWKAGKNNKAYVDFKEIIEKQLKEKWKCIKRSGEGTKNNEGLIRDAADKKKSYSLWNEGEKHHMQAEKR